MFSGSKFQSCGPVIEKEFLANEVHLNFGTIRKMLTFQTYIGSMSVDSDVNGVAWWAMISEGLALDPAGV